MAMTRPLRSTSITPASSLLQGSPPLSGASVLSASRLEPLAPCMGFCLSRSFGTPAHLLSFISFFVRSESPFLRPDPRFAYVGARRSCQGWPSHHLAACSAFTRPHLDSFEHDGTLGAVGMTIRGEPAFGRDQSRHNLVFGGSKDLNHDAVMRIGSETPKRQTHSSNRHEGQGTCRESATSNHHRPRHKRTDKAKTVGVPSTSSIHCAGRKTMPSGTTPSCTSRNRAIRSLRAKATIMVLRVPRAFSARARTHFAKALFFWNMSSRHAN